MAVGATGIRFFCDYRRSQHDGHGRATLVDQSGMQQGTKYVPPHLRGQQRANGVIASPAAPVVSTRQYSPAGKKLEFTVQLVLDLSSLRLKDGSHPAFKGHPPPEHHTKTAIHHYLAHICPTHGASFADVWLDIVHITFATVVLPADKVQDFKDIFAGRAAALPSLTAGCYDITSLELYRKEHRRDKATKGSDFYFFDVNSTTPGFEDTLRKWSDALRKAAYQTNGNCADFMSMKEQHITVRSFSLKTAKDSFRIVQKEVRNHPATIQCAGIRIQQSVDQALEEGTGQLLSAHAYFQKPVARYPVPLYTSCDAASHRIRLADNQRRMQIKNAAISDATVDDIIEKMVVYASEATRPL